MKKRFLSLLLCAVMLCSFIPQEIATASALAGDGMCEHHAEHTGDCGYSEGVEGSPCTHEHTEDCYILETNCVHSHDETCHPDETVSDNNTAPSEADEAEPTECTHVCSEESGCITKMLNCTHEHDETCGYAEAAEGTPCAYDCPVCSESEPKPDSTDAADTDADAQVLSDDIDADAQVLSADTDADAQVLSADTDADAQVLADDTVAVILNSDGNPDYGKQFITLQDAIWAVPARGTATIKIVKDITLSKSVSILTERNITLISDGTHTITAAQTAFSITNSAQYPNPSSLTIGTANDAEDKLTVMAGNQTTQLIYCNNSNFTFNSGILDGAGTARGVYLDNGSEFVMNGGKIENCSCAKNGGAVMMNSGSAFEMNGGMISNCKATLGGAIYLNEKSGFVMNSGVITLCEATSNGGGIYLGNGEKASFVMNGGTITECTTEYSGGGVYMGNGSDFTMNAGTISSCTSNQGGGIYMRAGANASFIMENGAITECTAKYDGGGVYMGDNNAFIMNDGSISNCGWVEGAALSRDGGGIYVKGENSSVIMNGGTISDCFAPDHQGGGIYANGANVTIKGTISGCEAKFGGGVSCTGKLNIMAGGTVEYCEATTKGGGIYLAETAALEMDDAVISGCEAGDGGGVYLAAGAKLSLLNESTISGCKAISYESNDTIWGSGGGIYLSASTTFTMKDSDIKDNTAGYLGGGIYIARDGTYTLTSGNISGNKTVDQYGYGGGIYVHKRATLNLTKVVIAKNTATALGGGIWSCRTGDIKIYIKDGGAVFDNDAINGDVKTVNEAGDDIASTVTFPAAGFLELSYHMLGGGANRYYVDGGITGFDAPDGRSAGEGLGAPDGKTARYDAAASTLVTETYITEAIALKNVVSEAARTAANKEAKLIITGNSASRGGGIGTNGNLIIGTPDPDSETGNLTVEKEVAGNDQETDKEFSIQVTLKRNDGTAADMNGEYGEMTFRNGIAIVVLKAGQSITATGLPAGISYTVEETAESREGYTVTYTNQAGTIGKDDTVIATVINTKDTPSKPIPETGSLTVSKTVSGNRASRTRAFTFTVTLDDQTISGTYGNMIFENGVAVFTLKSGESKTASDLPAGTGYTVEESDNKGYTVTVNGAAGTKVTGVITANTTVSAAFNNYKAGGGSTDHDPDPTPGPEPTPGRPVGSTPPTGDNSNISLWIALACFSLFSLAVSLFRRKRR